MDRLNGRDFRSGFSEGKKLVGNTMVVQISSNNLGNPRLGITCSSRYGIAVERNRFKRLVREAFRLTLDQLLNLFEHGVDIRVRPRQAAKGKKLHEIKQDLFHLFFNAFDGKSDITFDSCRS